MSAIGANIKFHRTALGISQPELGKRMNPPISGNRVYQIERSINLCGETVERVAKALDVSVELLTDLPDSGHSLPKPFSVYEKLLVVAITLLGIFSIVYCSIYLMEEPTFIVSQTPPSSEFMNLHALYPRQMELQKSWECYRTLSNEEQKGMGKAIVNYRETVKGRIKKFIKYDSNFFCNGVFRDYLKVPPKAD